MAAPADQQLTAGEPCDPGKARPLHVEARLAEAVVFNDPIMLDGLLAWVVAQRARLLPPRAGEAPARIEIPVMRAPGGRFHLCSEAHGEKRVSDLRHYHWRAPVHEMARMGTDKIGRVDISGGANKGSRVPFRADLVGKLEWWCLGDPELIRHLLSFVHYLGDRRGHGLGRLVLHDRPWTVEECEPWEGFPLVRDGLPTRPLPPDWPGLQDPQLGYRTISYPYWARHSSELCAVPVH